MTDAVPPHLAKYYSQRHRLFHRFSDGILMDAESWYSVTPEKIAAHIAQRFVHAGVHLVLDACCGAGGNTIQFALAGAHVLALDICPDRIAIAINNATVYGVDQYADFICADMYSMLPAIRRRPIDAIFLSPPWGGPEYQQDEVFDVEPFLELVLLAKRVSDNVAVLLPRNVSLENIEKHFGPCEVELNYLGSPHRPKTVTAYFGEMLTGRRVA